MTCRRASMTSGSVFSVDGARRGSERNRATRSSPSRDPRLDQVLAEIAGGGHEERGRAHRDVGDLQCEDLLAGLQLPLRLIGRLQRAGSYTSGSSAPFDNLLGEEARRVVRAGVLAQRGLGDVQRAGQDDHRQAAQVGADDADERQQPLGQRIVAAGDGEQLLARLLAARLRQRRAASCQRLRRTDLGVLVLLGERGGQRWHDRCAGRPATPGRAAAPPPPCPPCRSARPPRRRRGSPRRTAGPRRRSRSARRPGLRKLTVRRSRDLPRADLTTYCTARSMCSTVRSSMVSGSHGYCSGSNSEPSWRVHRQPRVVDAVVHGAEQGQQPVPGAGAVLQVLLAAVDGALLQLGAEPARRVRRA